MTLHSTQQKTGGMGSFIDDLNGAIRENPVAAGLVGMGVLWMFFGGDRGSALKSLAGAAGTVTSAVGAAAGATGSAASDVISGTVSRAGEVARQVGGALSPGAESAGAMVRDTASAGYDALQSKGGAAGEMMTRVANDTVRSSTERGRDFGMSMQRNLTESLERQPLLLGLIGVAIGAGIASAFPSTRMEQEMMGEAGAAVKDKIQEIASDTSERAKEVLDVVKKEAAAQGLTPAGATESLKGVAEKVKTVATTSRDAIKGRVS
jgi:phage-related protein